MHILGAIIRKMNQLFREFLNNASMASRRTAQESDQRRAQWRQSSSSAREMMMEKVGSSGGSAIYRVHSPRTDLVRETVSGTGPVRFRWKAFRECIGNQAVDFRSDVLPAGFEAGEMTADFQAHIEHQQIPFSSSWRRMQVVPSGRRDSEHGMSCWERKRSR